MESLVLCACLLFQAHSIQTDWTGGPGVAGPVDDFGYAFYGSDSVCYTSSGRLLPLSNSHVIITDWVEHIVEDNDSIDGHGAIWPADFDGDGDFDLAGAIDLADVIRVYRNVITETGVDTFVFEEDLPARVSRYCIAWAGDLDGNGYPDFVVPGDSMFWFQNTGGWSFTKQYIGFSFRVGDTNYCTAGDVDNDGDMDIVAGMKPLLLWRNNGDMTFARESIAPGRRYRATLGDLNNDNYLDLLQTDQVYLNPGPSHPGEFPHAPDWDAGFPAGESDGSWIADFDGDNDRDLLVCRQWPPFSFQCGIYWYENDGTGDDYTQHTILAGAPAYLYGDAAIAEDAGLDGLMDVAGGYARIGYFHQYPLGTFTEVVVDSAYGGSGGCHWVFVENLKKHPGGLKFTKDILASGSGTFHWWENGQDIGFSMNGWLESSILDAGEGATWDRLVWDASRPSNTQLEFYVRSGSNARKCTTNTWQGPFPVSVGVENDSVDIGPYTTPGDRYFQYRVFMAGYNVGSPAVAPIVYEVRVEYDLGTGNHPDVGIFEILAPAGWVRPSQAVTPLVWIHNYGDAAMSFYTRFTICDTATDAELYRDSVYISGLAPDHYVIVDFAEWPGTAIEGCYIGVCTLAVDDDVPANDLDSSFFTVSVYCPWPVGWQEVSSMPAHPSNSPVARGGWLAFDASTELLYAAKGNKTGDFYRYEPLPNEWYTLAELPYRRGRWPTKRPMKGARGICDNERHVYATQGNNTLGFWRYDIIADSWEVLPDVPAGPSRKKVKGGTDMVYIVVQDTGYVYLLKGYKTEFYRYNASSGVWQTRADAPSGSRARWESDSWLVADSDSGGYVYAHKAKYHELYRYDVRGDSWGQKMEGMPFVGASLRRKKSKDGGSAAWYDGAIYALKGGNTQEWWRYTVADSVWTELETMPSFGTTGKKKRVKHGGDVVSFGGGAFFALKGNKTLETWRYVSVPWPPQAATRHGGSLATGCVAAVPGGRLVAVPNPMGPNGTLVRCELPGAGPAVLTVYDAVGRAVARRPVLPDHSGVASVFLRGLRAGVYLVRVEAPGFAATRKLVVR